METASSSASGCRPALSEPLATGADTALLAEWERIRALNGALEKRMQEQAAQMVALRAELDMFSYSIAHDLRAPLRGIAGFTRALLEDHSATLNEDGLRLLGIVRDETRRMNLLIEGALAFSTVGRQPLDPSEIDMADLATDTFQQLTEAGVSRTPAFVVRRPLPLAFGDRGLIRRALTNLLANAIKFTCRQATPEIVVSGRIEQDESVYCVADNGVGFDQRYADRLFGVFQRLHSQEDFEGAGAGLALVRRVVQRHGGRTWAEGQVNGGARFYFTLPSGAEPTS